MKKPQSKVRVCRPPAGLSSLVNRPGGLLREIAIARSAARLEGRRASARETLRMLLDGLEAAATAPDALQRLPDLRRMIDPVIAVAGSFGMEPLVQAGMRLSELLLILAAERNARPQPIAVHLRAMRLFAGAAVDVTMVGEIMSELDRVLAHLCARAPRL